MPYIGKSNDGFGIRDRFIYLATSGDTTVSGTDTRGVSLTFSDPEYVDVYLNGVRLKLNTDYNLNTANTVSGLAALSENDEVEVIVYDVFSLADMVSANTGGTFNSNITVDGDLTVNDDLSLLSDASVLNFGADSEIKLTHVADTGLLLTDSGGTPTLQLTDANESIASDGSKVIITSGGTAFSLPTADGSANQVLATDGSGTLSFFDALASSAVSTFGGTLIDDADASTARTTLGLGTAATTASTDYVAKTASTGSGQLPSGTTAQRDGSPAAGMIRFNSTTSGFEGYDGSAWGAIGGGASAGGAIYENSNEITADYTLTTDTNGMSVSPMTIASGVTVTVPSGQRWVVL